MAKPVLCLDFDGVIHRYNSGWQGAGVIPDEPVPGALQFILDAQEHFTVAIFSARSQFPEGRAAMQLWLRRKALEGGYNLGWIGKCLLSQLGQLTGKKIEINEESEENQDVSLLLENLKNELKSYWEL